MAETDEKTSAFLEAADHLERWADSLPRWDRDGRETWYEFLDRRYEAEVTLIAKLHLAPRCRIQTCPRRRKVDLTLGGITVHTDQGLAAALRAWASQARQRLGR